MILCVLSAIKNSSSLYRVNLAGFKSKIKLNKLHLYLLGSFLSKAPHAWLHIPQKGQ